PRERPLHHLHRRVGTPSARSVGFVPLGHGRQGEMDQTLNQLLVEMDGMDTTGWGRLLRCQRNRHTRCSTPRAAPGLAASTGTSWWTCPTLIEAQELCSRDCTWASNKAGGAAVPTSTCAGAEAAAQKPPGPAPHDQGGAEAQTAYSEVRKALVALDAETAAPPVFESAIVPKAAWWPEPGLGTTEAQTESLYTCARPCWRPSPAHAGRRAALRRFRASTRGGSDEQAGSTDLALQAGRPSWACPTRIATSASTRSRLRGTALTMSPSRAETEAAVRQREPRQCWARAFRRPGSGQQPGPSGPGGPRPARQEELGHEQLLELLGTVAAPEASWPSWLDLAKD
uniref:ShKT domain-containing protein n=1 Tax=Macrostomum lignano TaxID=282301 RepID=A0A1I8FHQ5_9PLAT